MPILELATEGFQVVGAAVDSPGSFLGGGRVMAAELP